MAVLRCYQLEEALLFKQSEINKLNEENERLKLQHLLPVSSENYWKTRASTYENLYYELAAEKAMAKYDNADFLAVMKTQSESIEALLRDEKPEDFRKVRESLELTKALKDSMTREEILKAQKDDLMETLEKASSKEQNPNNRYARQSLGDAQLITKIHTLEEEVQTYKDQINLLTNESKKRKSFKSTYTPKKRAEVEEVNELLSANDLDSAADKWKSLEYCELEGEPLEYSYECLRNILKLKDSQLNSILSYNRSRDNNTISNLISQLKEKQNEIEVLKNTIAQPQKDVWREGEVKAMKLKISCLEEELRNKQGNLEEAERVINTLNEKVNSLEERLNIPTQTETDLRNLVKHKDAEINALISQLENARVDCDMYRNKLVSQSSIDAALLEKESYIAELEQEIKHVRETRYESGSQFKDSEKPGEVSDLKARNARLERENKGLQNLRDTLKSDISRLQRLFDEERQGHTNTIKLLESGDPKIVEKHTEKYLSTLQTMFNSEIQDLTSKVTTLQAELSEKSRDLARLDEKYRQDIQDLHDQLRKEHEKSKDLNNLLRNERTRSEGMKKELDSLSAKFKLDKDREREILEASLREKNAEIARKITEAKDREVIIIEKNKEIAKLKDEIMKLRDEFDDQIQTKSELVTSVQELEEQLKRDKHQISELKAALDNANRAKETQGGVILEKDREINLLKDEMNKLSEDISNYETHYTAQIQHELDLKTSELEDLKSVYDEKIAHLNAQLEQSYDRERKLREDKIEVENNLNKEMKLNTAQTKELAEIKYENKLLAEQLKHEKQAMNDEKATLHHDLAIQRDQLSYLQTKIKDLQSIEKQLDMISTEHEIMKQELNITQREKEELRALYDKRHLAESETMKLRKEIESLREKLRALELTIQTLENDKRNLIESCEASKQETRELRTRLEIKERERSSTPVRDSSYLDQLQQKDTIITFLTKKLDELSADRRRAEEIQRQGDRRHESSSRSDSPLRISELPNRDLESVSNAEKRYARLVDIIEEIYNNWQRELRGYNIRLDDVLAVDRDTRVKEMFDTLLSKVKDTMIKSQDDSISRLQQSSHSSDRLLKAIQDGQLQNIEIKQLIMEKIGLEQDLLGKIRERLEDDRVLSKIQTGDSDEFKTWALKRWQNAENEVLTLRQKLAEMTEKQANKSNGFSFDLKSHIERLEERVKQLDETKQQNTELFHKEKAQLMSELKQLRKQKEEISAQYTKMRREFETKERSWKIALMNLVDQVKIALDSPNSLNPEADPLKLLVSLQNCFDKTSEDKYSKKSHEQERKAWSSKKQEMSETIKKLLSDKASLENRIESYELTISELQALKPQLEEARDKISNLQSEITLLNEKILRLSTYKRPEKPDTDKRIKSELRDSYERGKLIGISEGRKLERQELEGENARLQSLLREYRESRDDLYKKNRELTLKLESSAKDDRYYSSIQRENELLKVISDKDKEIHSLRELLGCVPEPQLTQDDIRLELMERRHSAMRDLQEWERKHGVSDPALRTYIQELDSVLSRYEEV
jgi:chromosome segregation ATPase